jgi:hypothetical protein
MGLNQMIEEQELSHQESDVGDGAQNLGDSAQNLGDGAPDLGNGTSRSGNGASSLGDGAPSLGDGAGYAIPTTPLSVPVLQAALEVERHGREWLEHALATRQAERDELRREVERLRETRGARLLDAAFGEARAELQADVERLREALRMSEAATSELNEQITSAKAEAAALASQVAALERERSDLRRQLTEVTSELNVVVLKRDVLSRERDTLVREAQAHQAQTQRVPAASPVDATQPTVAELGQSLELIAESVGAVRAWTQDPGSSEQRSIGIVTVLEDRLRLLLAPLATLPELRIQVARLSAQLATVASGGSLPARGDIEVSAPPLIQEPDEASPALPVETIPVATDQPCQACQEQQARSVPVRPR